MGEKAETMMGGRVALDQVTRTPCRTSEEVASALETGAYNRRIARLLELLGISVSDSNKTLDVIGEARDANSERFDELVTSLTINVSPVVLTGLKKYLESRGNRPGEEKRDWLGEFDNIVKPLKSQYMAETGLVSPVVSRRVQFGELFAGIDGVDVTQDNSPEPELTAEDWLRISKMLSKENPETVFWLPQLVESEADKLSVALAILVNPPMAEDLARDANISEKYPEVVPLLDIKPIDFTTATKETIEQIETDDRGRLQLEIGKAQIASGDLTSAIETTKQIKSVYDRGRLQLEIGKAQIASGDLTSAKETAEQIEDGYSRGLLQIEIGKVSGDLTAAIKTVKHIEDAHDYNQLQLEIGKAQIASGDLTSAKETAGQIEDAHIRGRLQLEIAKAQNEVNSRLITDVLDKVTEHTSSI